MSSPTTEMPTDMAVIDDTVPSEAPSIGTPTVEIYQETLLGAAIKAATLLDELMGLSIIPDPRVKDAADVALQLVALMNTQVSVAASQRATSEQLSEIANTKKSTKEKAS